MKELVAEILAEALNDPENASAELPNKLKGLTNIWSQKMRSIAWLFSEVLDSNTSKAQSKLNKPAESHQPMCPHLVKPDSHHCQPFLQHLNMSHYMPPSRAHSFSASLQERAAAWDGT